MPFQDIEEPDIAQAPRIPSATERWLRKLLFDDWSLKLLALAITIVLWLAVTGQNKPMKMSVSGVQLNFLRPDGLDLSNEPPHTVEVILTGSKEKLDRIGPRDLIATVDLSDQKAGERILKLTPGSVKMDLREDVKIQGFYPAAISIRLEPIIERSLEVEVKFEGKLPEGFEVTGVIANPAKIRVRGPADHINTLGKAVTETVLLQGKKESFKLSQIEITIADPKIELLDPTVDIQVEISEKKRDAILRFATANEAPYLAGLIMPARRP